MNEENTTTPHTALIVIGASGRIGREVARLGVAYGVDVFGICRDGVPPNDEAWTHGVTWLARDATDPAALDDLPVCPLVIASPIELPDAWVDRFARIVVVGGPISAHQLATGPLITASPGPIDDSPLEVGALNFDAMRVETVAMALLRAALDEGLPQHLGPEELAHYGDAVMLQ